MQRLSQKGGSRFGTDRIPGQLLLQLVVGVMRYIADTASIDDGGLLFLGQESIKFRIVAGCNDQRVDGPLVSVDFDHPVLDHPQIDLYQILFVLVYFVAEVNAAAGHPGKGAAPKIEPVRIVGIGNVQQPLNRFFSQQIHGRRGDLILGRVFARQGTETFR